MNQRLTAFLQNLAQQPPTASVWYPSVVGSLDAALMEEDLEILEELEGRDLVILGQPQERGGRLIGVRVELTNLGREWASQLKS